MTKCFLAAVTLVVFMLCLGACGSSKHLQSASSNPQVQKDTQQAEKEVSTCFSKNFNLASKATRKAFVLCIGHGRNPKETEACVAKIVGKDLPLHHKRFVQDTAQGCVLR